jgi:hypothetical protein
MTPERGERVYAVFEAALKCDPAGRATLLDELCSGDSDLRTEVECLLADDQRAIQDNFLVPPDVLDRDSDRARLSPFRLRGLDLHILCPHCRNPIELERLTVGRHII